jgi:phosphoribosylamine--glycine ligase
VETLEQGVEAVSELGGPGGVVKADGLAAGKGVTVAQNAEQAHAALHEIFVEHRFGGSKAGRSSTADRPGTENENGTTDQTENEAGRTSAVVEELLFGEELSLLALCDGVRALPMAPARDFKRIFEGDEGPNTGGMGSYSPVAGIEEAVAHELVATVHQPVVDLMAKRGTPFHGVLYAGLMLTTDGPRVLEFNTRFGDPETQAVLPRLRSDLLELLQAATGFGGLEGVSLEWTDEWAVTLVLASAGYPASSSNGDEIRGLEDLPNEIEITHAGTTASGGAVVTAGGRVLNVTALGSSAESARTAAYAAAEKISFDGMQLRRDIAANAEREATTTT